MTYAIKPQTSLAINLRTEQPSSQESLQNMMIFSPTLLNKPINLTLTSPDGFRQRVNERCAASKLEVLHHKHHTILFDQQRKICAIIAAPGVNGYGQTQSLRYYFPTDEHNSYVPKALLLTKIIINGTYAYSAIAKHKISKVCLQLFNLTKYITQSNSTTTMKKTLLPIHTQQKTSCPVWTSLRLTA